MFEQDPRLHLPRRVLPLSTTPPTDLATLFEHEAKEVQRLLKPGKHRKAEAAAKLRALAIVDGAMRGDRIQPTDGELRKLGDSISKGTQWSDVFPGVAAIELSRLAPGAAPRGIRRFRSCEEANLDRDKWTGERARNLRAARRTD